MESKGSKLPPHLELAVYSGAERNARELGDDPIEAIHIAEQAFAMAIEQNNVGVAADLRIRQSLSYGHLADRTGSDTYRVTSMHMAQAGVEIARRSGLPEALAIPLFGAGRALGAIGEYEEAVKLYEEAIEALPHSDSNKPSVNADLRVHLETAKYHSGDKDALPRALEALSDLEVAEESKYEKDVWISGGYMKIAEAIFPDNPEKAREYLEKAGKVIDSNSELKLRRVQLDNLITKLQ